jgi:ribonuclease HII
MLVYAGIDEAGYGPMLGPLCVACSAFVLQRHEPAEGPPNLWTLLAGAVCRRPGDKKRRVAVDDSKKLKGAADGASHPLRHLERGVLSFVPADALPRTDTQLLALLEAEVPARPWFASTTRVPLGFTTEELGIARARVQRALGRAAICCEALTCEAIDAAELNGQLAETGSKATVNFRAATRQLEAVWRRWPDAHPRVVIDRHGARTSYGRLLQRCLPGAAVEVVAETPTLSRYVLRRGGSALTVSFAVGGDGRFLPVALASMAAKYVRELLMLRLNRFFQHRLPQLKPTAGYHGDARRYVTEIKPVMEQLGVSRSELVRSA